MEILGAGFYRTGTMSTRKALVDLGLTPCFHMESVVSNNLVSLFLQYFKGNKQPLVDYIKNEGYKARDRFVKHKFASFFDSTALVLQIQSQFDADSHSKPP